MVKSLEESAAERRSYIEQARAAFQNPVQGRDQEYQKEEPVVSYSTFGIRIVIAVLLFAAFIYCDQEKITFQCFGTKDLIKQIEWNPLPTEELEKLLKDVEITNTP